MKKIIILILLSIFFISCKNSTKPKIENKYWVKYEVIGTKALVITIANEAGGTSQFTDVKLPWSYEMPHSMPKGTFVYVSAQNAGSGDITVIIYRAGSIFKKAKSSGEYAIAEASGEL